MSDLQSIIEKRKMKENVELGSKVPHSPTSEEIALVTKEFHDIVGESNYWSSLIAQGRKIIGLEIGVTEP